MTGQASFVGLISYAAGALAFVMLGVVLARGRRRQPSMAAMLMASLLTAAWCGTIALSYWIGRDLGRVGDVLEQARIMAWLACLWILLTSAAEKPVNDKVRTVARIALAGFAAVLALEILRPLPTETFAAAHNATCLILVIAGFTLIENLIRNAPSEQRWGIKFLCIGIGAVFTYELFYYANALLFRSPIEGLALARGAIHALVVPLLLIASLRSDMWESRIAISHRTAVYSTALIASGAYLLLMSASAYYIRFAGGSWGPVIQATFLFGGMVVLVTILASGAARAYIKVLISKHFFEYKYDYREEWIRFMRTVSEGQPDSRLELRVIKGLADTVDSPAGALWLRVSGRYAVESTWNMAVTSLGEAEMEPLTGFLSEKEWIVNLAAVSERPDHYPNLVVPETLKQRRDAWILVPLVHRAAILGFVVLARPRAPRELTWEDYDLLKLLARQSASYLAEQWAARELAEARQFERFNRRATFVMHDLKNIVSELSLLSTNIEKHGDNPEFRKDMTALMAETVAKMRRLMDRMHPPEDAGPADGAVRIRPLLDRFVAVEQGPSVRVQDDTPGGDLAVRADHDRLSAMLTHLVQNAIDATGRDGWVRIALSRQDGSAIVEVTDNGPGMDPEFVRCDLFTPFRSTKAGGFGIGAYQCRQYARELGGDIEVISSPGSGTTMRLMLPLAAAPAQEAPPVAPGGL